MSVMSFTEFTDRLNDFGDQMNLGIKHTGKDEYCYINLYPINNRRYKFIEIKYIQDSYHIISYLDQHHVWIENAFNDYSIPEFLLYTIKEQYLKAAANYKYLPYRQKLLEIEKDFV